MPLNNGLQYGLPSPQYDGVFPYLINPQPGLPPAQTTNMIGKVGAANWGPMDTPVFYNTLTQAIAIWGAAASILIASGAGSGNNCSLVGATQAQVPEGTLFCDVRVGDGTQAPAIGILADSASAAVANLSAIYDGTDGNSIATSVSLSQGSFAPSGTLIPMAQITVNIMNRPSWTSVPFIAGTALAGYVKATFLANLQFALNGGGGFAPCPYVVYVSSGSSALAPKTAFNNTFSGGISGNTTITSAVLVGAPATGNNTGMYALSGTGMNVFHLCGMTDLSQASVVAAFAQAQTAVAFMGLPVGTTTSTGITTKQTDNAASPWLVICNDFTYNTDVVDGTGTQPYDPAAKMAAGVASLAPYQPASNKPYVGFQNLVGTYRSQQSNPYTGAELGLLQQAGILVINRPANRGNVFCMTHNMSSDGVTPISDTRMLNLIANELTLILGQFVGETQTPLPASGSDTDITRNNARNAVIAYFQTLTNPNAPQIANYSQTMNSTNNSNAQIAAGYLFDSIEVTTLAGIRFILLGLQVGETVQITTPPTTAS